jgi:O-succinylbenzoic acid--CoA ligase
VVVHERFDVDRFAAEPDVTLVSLVPTQLTKLLDAGVDLGRFRVILLGGAAATPHLLRRAAAAGAPVVTTYGMSETAGGCVYDGRPLTGVDVALDPDGRIRMRGPMLMSGYRGEPELTAATLVDGWLVTPDAGYWDTGYRDGDRLVVSGRLDDVIVSGGENVSAAAVAGCLVEHPSISDAVVVGVPDEQWGQRVVAVVATVGAAPALPELQSWVRDRQPEAAVPRALVVVDDIPRLSSGKPDRLAVQALAGG